MLGQLQKEKMTRLFRMWDADGNGFLELDDWTHIAERYAKLEGIGAEAPEFEGIRSLFTSLWDVLRGFADTNRDERVSLDEFLAYCEGEFGGVEGVAFQQFPDRQRAILEAIVNRVDRDQDGRISFADHCDFLSVWLGDDVTAQAKAAFERRDQDRDGFISVDETKEHIAEFLLSNDPAAPGNWLFV